MVMAYGKGKGGKKKGMNVKTGKYCK